jgi:hypothetical protein
MNDPDIYKHLTDAETRQRIEEEQQRIWDDRQRQEKRGELQAVLIVLLCVILVGSGLVIAYLVNRP